jgi:hypothetical protein
MHDCWQHQLPHSASSLPLVAATTVAQPPKHLRAAMPQQLASSLASLSTPAAVVTVPSMTQQQLVASGPPP